MAHETPLITTIVGGLVLAFLFGMLANRLRLPPLVGYLLAGIIAGPHTPGFTANVNVANELAELGVILLMFGVGLHFSVKDLLSVKAVAIPGAVAQIGVATVLGMGLAWTFDWSFGAGLVFGLSLSTASTVVLLRALEERSLLKSREGRVAIGWLIVEDLVMVLALVLLPTVAALLQGGPASGAGGADISLTLLTTIGKVAAFVAVMLLAGRRVIPWVLEHVVQTRNRELFRLAVLALALGVAYGASVLFDVSFALGAFFAGMVMAESQFGHRAAQETLPLRDAFSVLFFVSVGMLFDPMIIVQDPWGVIGTFFIIVFGKSAAAYFLVKAFGYPRLTGLTISASLAQIGEFAFILAGLGVVLGILPPEGRSLVLAGALLSIVVNPALFAWLDRYRGTHPAEAAAAAPDGVSTPGVSTPGLSSLL